MKCDQAAPLLDPHLDGELQDERGAALALHLAGCPACAAKLDRRLGLRGEIRALGRFAAPPELERRLRRMIQAASIPRRRQPFAWRSFGLGLGAGAAAATAVVLAAVFIASPVTSTRTGSAVDFMSAHLRSLPSPDSTQIASSDPHTIRPWLAGRTDLSPRVADLGDLGYKLLGARIDYVDGRPAVALVYGRRKHLINLFVQAADGAPDVAATAARRGLALRSWRDADLLYVAVSDVSAEELESFMRLVRVHAGGAASPVK